MLVERTPARKDADRQAVCTGCGAEIIEPSQKLCPDCGKIIGEGFRPLDAIRSSYNLQGKQLSKLIPAEPEALFPRSGNPISETAWACTVYSMVPYLGILFVPLAIAVGGFGYVVSRRTPDAAGGRAALTCIGVTLILLAMQILFWWLLYLIPEIGI